MIVVGLLKNVVTITQLFKTIEYDECGRHLGTSIVLSVFEK